VREATFNALFSLGVIEDATFVDLFAGSGALGLEALSRGAHHCTFIERDRHALEALRTNIATLGFEDAATVVGTDSMRWLVGATHHDVILADPPYGFDDWDGLLTDVSADLVVAESHDALGLDDEGGDRHGWEILRERSYGSTFVTILRRASPGQSPLTKESPE